MWKNTVERDRPHITILRMRSACWTPKATNTYSQYVIITAFPLQQWLHERASMLRFTCIACLLSSFRRQFSAWNYREWSKQCCIALGHRQCKHSVASHWTPTVQAQCCIALDTDSASTVLHRTGTPTVQAQCCIALDTDSASTLLHRTGHRQCKHSVASHWDTDSASTVLHRTGHRQCKHSVASHWKPTVQAQCCIALETDSASSVASHWTPTVLAQCRIALDTDSASTVSHRTGHRQCSPHAAWQN